MTNTEKYNGWANRETWAFMLHLNNDHGLYEMAHEWAREALSAPALRHDDTEDVKNYMVGDYVIRMARELWADHREHGMSFVQRADNPVVIWERETGSVWRVDATEVGASLREDLDGE